MFESQIVALNDFDLRRVYYPTIRMDVSHLHTEEINFVLLALKHC